MDFTERVAVENGVSPPVADSDARVVLVEVAALRGVSARKWGRETDKQVWMALREAGHGGRAGESGCASGGMDV